MGHVVRIVLVVVAGGAALAFGVKALRHWWAERAGRAYELTVDRTGTALRGGAAGLAAVLAGVLALPLLDLGPGGPSAGPAGSSAAAPVRPVVPSPPPRTPAPAPPPPEVHTLGHPAGGTLDQFGDGTRVWLPPQYGSRHAVHLAFPVLVVHLPGTAGTTPPGTAPAAGSPGTDLFDGFALAVQRGLADPFVLVLPPTCDRDAAALAEAALRYRVLPARTATGLMGIGADAPCAVREAFASPTRFAAAAGISGHYPSPAARPTATPPTPAPALPHPARNPSPGPSPTTRPAPRTGTGSATPTAAEIPLLLASRAGEGDSQTSALRLRDALRPHGDDVRLIDGIPSSRELFAQVAAYLTEKLDAPATPTSLPPASYPPPASAQPHKPAQTP